LLIIWRACRWKGEDGGSCGKKLDDPVIGVERGCNCPQNKMLFANSSKGFSRIVERGLVPGVCCVPDVSCVLNGLLLAAFHKEGAFSYAHMCSSSPKFWVPSIAL